MNTFLTTDEIVSIEKYNCNSKRYDISVETNENLFANNILAHNCQNMSYSMKESFILDPIYITEKVDGTSSTFIYRPSTLFRKEEFMVCSRNFLKEYEDDSWVDYCSKNQYERKDENTFQRNEN